MATTAQEFFAAEFGLRRHISILEILFARLQSKRRAAKMRFMEDEENQLSLDFQIELMRDKVKVDCLLQQMKLARDKGKLDSLIWKIQMRENVEKAELLKKEMEQLLKKGKLDFPMLEIQLGQNIVQSELLLEEVNLVQESPLLEKVFVKQIQASEFLVRLTNPLPKNKIPHPFVRYVVKLKSLLEEMKLKRKESKRKNIKLSARLQQTSDKPNARPHERHVIVIGGRGQDGQSLRSVEGYIFREGRWIELPAMNTPRSFMSSVVVGNEIVVSGGDTGDAITDTIEVLNLSEIPLQWRMSPARLPVPLSAHQTVVYEERLIVIGGHDGNEGRRSDRIYEVRLTPPYMTRILAAMDTPVAWHGAALMGDEIFIFGGEIGGYVPTPDVLVFDLNSNMFSERQPLPRAVKGMATVVQEQSVAVVGGLDRNEQELDRVFMYDTRSGERHDLPQMSEERGGCSAAISFTLDTGGFTDALFVLGSVRSVNTVERFSFGSHRWIDMPPTREARGFCSIVIAPIELPLE